MNTHYTNILQKQNKPVDLNYIFMHAKNATVLWTVAFKNQKEF